MTGSGWRLLAFVALIFASSVFLRGQVAEAHRVDIPPRPPAVSLSNLDLNSHSAASLAPARGTISLPQISRSAGIIFSGYVVSVGSRATVSTAPSLRGAGVTSVTFRVEHGMRGVVTGQQLTIHEWAGLSARGERYRVGERVLLFLFPPSKLGLTSPVSGALGRFVVDTHDRIMLNPRTHAALASDPTIRGRSSIPYFEFERAVLRVATE